MNKRIYKVALPLMVVTCLAFLMAASSTFAKGDPDFDPPLAPLGPVPDPMDNSMTPEKIELGKMLYFDPKISGDASLACVDCHHPEQGWGFNEPICRGYPGTVHWRNCQTVVNTGYLNKVFWAGSTTSLEKQAKSAAQGGVAGNGELDVMDERLRQTPEYVELFRKVYGAEQPNVRPLAYMAIAAFERGALSQVGKWESPLDKYLKGKKSALSKKAVKGMKLFEGKANCIECHNGPMLTDEKFYNIGVPRPEEWETIGLNQITFRFELYAKGVYEDKYRNYKDDLGLYFQTKQKKDLGKFRTAPLRYLKYTAPYMHAGQFFTLEEVIDFYNDGGGENDFTKKYGTKTKILKPLGLTDGEKEALVAFLEEISGKEIKIGSVKVPKMKPFPDVKRLTQKKAKITGIEFYLDAQGIKY
ncbi:MAG: cytochrome-c peroxidase [Deltaproteobacteria bacterium]|nr:cytochrome-c peroxidase [Deltaproteobacteria bacterium]